MPDLKYLPPEEKRMYMIVGFGAASFGFGLLGDALPALGSVLFPLAALCAVVFVFAIMGPAEKLFPLRTFPKRVSPALWSWVVYVAKVILFFGVPTAVLYVILRAIR